MDITQQEWMKTNQQYLIAEINVIKAKLLVYQDSLQNKKTLSESTQQLERADGELEHLKKEAIITPRLKRLVEVFQLSPFEKNMLLLGVGIELDTSLSKIIGKIQGDVNAQTPTLGLVLAIFPDAYWSALTPEATLRYWQLIELNKNDILTNSSFSVDEMILHYLTGINSMDSQLKHFVTQVLAKGVLVPSHQRIKEKIVQYLSQPPFQSNKPVIQLQGNSIEDQKAIAAQIFVPYNLTVFSLPVQLLPNNFYDLTQWLQRWNREVILHNHVLFLDGKQLESLDQATTNYVKYIIENIKGIVILCTSYKFDNISKAIYTLDVRKPLKKEQQLLWTQQLGTVAESLDEEIGNLVTQFNLDSHTIRQLAQQTMISIQMNGSLGDNKLSVKENLWQSCCNYTRPNLSSLAQRIEAIATWDDLVLPASQKAILEEICIHVKQRQKVYEQWGFSSKSNRGLGISALFAGESGTGKTMASEVIANALQLDLYRIDLSQVINKYIGETEKNLKKIFDAAEDSGAILLFDEADALFGKRSEVKDSHDRHSNIEVSYLLQKMEEYRGLAILTTNMKNALDKAFLRRIRFVIQFPFPDVQMRGEIWKRAFPKQTPTKELNIPKLANLNVAGGNIRNIALNATFAAAHKNEAVTMLDIHNAARNEYSKLEKHMSPSESLI